MRIDLLIYFCGIPPQQDGNDNREKASPVLNSQKKKTTVYRGFPGQPMEGGSTCRMSLPLWTHFRWFGIGIRFIYSLRFALYLGTILFCFVFDAFEQSRERVYSTFLARVHLMDVLGVRLATT